MHVGMLMNSMHAVIYIAFDFVSLNCIVCMYVYGFKHACMQAERKIESWTSLPVFNFIF